MLWSEEMKLEDSRPEIREIVGLSKNNEIQENKRQGKITAACKPKRLPRLKPLERAGDEAGEQGKLGEAKENSSTTAM